MNREETEQKIKELQLELSQKRDLLNNYLLGKIDNIDALTLRDDIFDLVENIKGYRLDLEVMCLLNKDRIGEDNND